MEHAFAHFKNKFEIFQHSFRSGADKFNKIFKLCAALYNCNDHFSDEKPCTITIDILNNSADDRGNYDAKISSEDEFAEEWDVRKDPSLESLRNRNKQTKRKRELAFEKHFSSVQDQKSTLLESLEDETDPLENVDEILTPPTSPSSRNSENSESEEEDSLERWQNIPKEILNQQEVLVANSTSTPKKQSPRKSPQSQKIKRRLQAVRALLHKAKSPPKSGVPIHIHNEVENLPRKRQKKSNQPWTPTK